MKAPFIWFGGKRKVAKVVWDALGDVDNYVEPFAGSLAVLLERPAFHEGHCETVNDADAFLANFWRALSKAPEEVAKHADWPVNEVDLFARHLWLVQHGKKGLQEKLEADPEAFDSKAAGWWVWGLNQWIGSGWCSGEGPWTVEGGEARKRPHLGDSGRGPALGVLPVDESLLAYFRELATRLRKVRVCCGDWSRVVTDGALSFGGTVGVFLDPPYLGEVRTGNLYAHDDHSVAHEVREWALAHGGDKRLRIVMAGYEDEHEAHMPSSWRRHAYSASAAYQTSNADGANQANRHKERLWLSPHCLVGQGSLFS